MENVNEYGKRIEEKISFELKKAIIKNSKIPELYLKYKWKDYNPHKIENKIVKDESVIRSRENAKEKCIKYCYNTISHYDRIKKDEGFDRYKSIIIYGAETSGKTVLATLIARTLAEKSKKNILYVDFMDLNSTVYTILDFRSETFTMALEKYLAPDILIIDEIAKSKIAPMLEPFLSALIRQRQSNDNCKITIITSKVSPDGIENLVGEDCARILKKESEFLSIEILAQKPYRLESFEENIYDLNKINKMIYKDFLSKSKENSVVEITESQLRNIMNMNFVFKKSKKEGK